MVKSKLNAIALAAVAACVATQAFAAVYDVPVTGNLNGNLFSANLVLNVTNGTVTSSAGSTFTGFGLVGASLALITTSTPGNETTGVAQGYGPVGFRANDGTDLYGADQAFPITPVNGLLFDVGTTTPAAKLFPLLGIASGAGNTGFTGMVGSTEYYAQFGSASIGPAVQISGGVPEPSTWAMMLLGAGGLGLLGYKRRNNATIATA